MHALLLHPPADAEAAFRAAFEALGHQVQTATGGRSPDTSAASTVPDLVVLFFGDALDTTTLGLITLHEREADGMFVVGVYAEDDEHVGSYVESFAPDALMAWPADPATIQAHVRLWTNRLVGRNDQRRTWADLGRMDAEARLGAVLDTTVDGIITMNEEGLILSFNKAAERIFGYTADEVVGANIKRLMPEPYRSQHDAYLERYRRTGRKRIIGIGREVYGKRKDGTTFPLDLAVSELTIGGSRIFTGILRDITERRRLEQEILRISDLERQRIGQDLHDGLGQMLTGTGLITQSLVRRLEAADSSFAEDAEEIRQLIHEADQYTRTITRGLTPVELDASGLSNALERLASNAERLFGIQCHFESSGDPAVQDNSAATHLYRIAQEAVSNAVKHGKASTVTIHLEAAEDDIRLTVLDDGVGFPDQLDEEKRGMGVHIMGYRARIMGARLDIRRRDGGGTVVQCILPQTEPVGA